MVRNSVYAGNLEPMQALPASLNLSAASSYLSDLGPKEKKPPLEAEDSLALASLRSRSAEAESLMVGVI
jgi:hypothetical protein